MQKKNSKLMLNVVRVFFILVGVTLVSIALELILIPNNIIDGGVTGVSIILSYLSSIPLGTFILLINIPFLILGYKRIGKKFTLSTLFSITSLSIGVTIFAGFDKITDDVLLASVFGGVILGIGVGIIMRSGGSLDGTEIVAILLEKKVPFSVGEIVMFINIFILGSAGLVFDLDRALYSLITYFIAYKVIDLVLEGFDQSRSAWIISNQHEEIAKTILEKFDRGVTYFNGEGAYSGENKKILFCIISRLEESELKKLVDDIDSNAFLSIGHVHDVKGGSFNKKGIHS